MTFQLVVPHSKINMCAFSFAGATYQSKRWFVQDFFNLYSAIQELTIEMFQETAVSSSEDEPDRVDDPVYESQVS